jgi:hypothetical protein
MQFVHQEYSPDENQQIPSSQAIRDSYNENYLHVSSLFPLSPRHSWRGLSFLLISSISSCNSSRDVSHHLYGKHQKSFLESFMSSNAPEMNLGDFLGRLCCIS